MKRKRILSFLILSLCLLFPTVSFAKDTDIYMATGEGVEPNILIIFDNSVSMRVDKIPTRTYDPGTTYDPIAVPADGKVYRYKTTTPKGWVWFADSIAAVPCSTARTQLSTTGQYTGNTSSSCKSSYYQLQTANRRNYEASGGDAEEFKLRIAKDVIKELLDESTGISGVRVGLMIFNPIVDDDTVHGWGGFWGGDNAHGGYIPENCEIKSLTSSHRTTLKDTIENISANSYTPLAETLYEAGIYFKGGVDPGPPNNDHHGYFNPDKIYASPIQFSCQKNYVIFMTDGDPTRDDGYRPGDSETDLGDDAEAHPHILSSVVGDRDGDGFEPGGANRVHYEVYGSDMGGTDYLDDVAKYLYDTDLRPDLTGTQNVITYTIGFAVTPQHDLLGRTATLGGGEYYTANNTAELKTVFQHVIGQIMETCSSFVAPIVPVSRMEKETAGDKIYLALFQPNNDLMWSGNIKRFGVVQSGDDLGQIVDKDNILALDSYGQIKDTATSHWPTDVPDGSDVEKGGVGAKLKTRDSARNIYTFQGSYTPLNHSSNAFDTDHITAVMLGVADDTAKDKLVNFVHGLDAYDDDRDSDTTEKRNWLLGSFLHSRPYIIHYPNKAHPDLSKSYIFAGSNDGMLHAFDDSDGSETWAFIPPNLLGNLQALRADVNAVFVDGSPKAYIEYNSDGEVQNAILIFGERRGGNRYYALNVTTPNSPEFLWEISPDGRVYLTNPIDPTAGYQKLGQTWSSPTIGKIACQEGALHCINVTDHVGERWVAFIGGGYDENQDNNPVIADDSAGMAVYVVDVLDGSLVKRFSVTEYPVGSTYPMIYSIPSDIARVDTDGDGKVNRLYVGDMGGQMWRFDIDNPDPTIWAGRIIFKSNPGYDSTTGRKIFYPPDVTLEIGNYEMLSFGTGDREHPDEETVTNRIYALKDKSSIETMPILTESNLIDVTTDELQAEGTTQERINEILSDLSAAYGWLIKLDLDSGEKSLAAPVVFYKVAYFTTFSPTATGDPCQAGFGTARLYAVDYTTGNAVFNYDLTNDTFDAEGKRVKVRRRTDRSKGIGSSIPSGVIITFMGDTAVAFIGVGGGVYAPDLSNTRSVVPLTWKIVF